MIKLNEENFKPVLEQSSTPVLVDFWMTGCGPCMMLVPTIVELSKKYSGQLVVGAANLGDTPEQAKKYNITAAPTLVVFVEGEEAGRLVGQHPYTAVDGFIKEFLQ